MKIMDTSQRAGVSCTEFHATDLDETFLLIDQGGLGQFAVSDRKQALRKLNIHYGKAGGGVWVDFSVKTGPVTSFAVTQSRDGRLKMVATEGNSLTGPTLNIGNTNSPLRFSLLPPSS